MPIYEYKCQTCNETVEITKSMHKRNEDEKCPKCGKLLRRKLSAPAFQLKGSGWYVTDYKKEH